VFIRKYRIQFFFLLAFFSIFLFVFPAGRSNSETVLLTGGLGFIGSNLVDELLVEGYNVIIFDDKSTGNNYNAKAITIIGDITVKEDFRHLNTLRVDFVVHFAAAISVAESMEDPAKYERINFEGSENVIEWATSHKVRKIVAASSAAVYGIPNELPLTEDSPLGPISPYAETKLNMEQLFKKYNKIYGIDAICLRFFNVYGPRQSPKSSYSGVISKFLDQSVKGDDLVIYGDGKNTRDFVFVKDVARANIAAIQMGTGFKVYNVGTESITTLSSLASTIIRVTDSESKIDYKKEREGDIKDSLSNTTKIRMELGWAPRVTLEQGLRRTYNWYKAEVLKLR